MGFFSSLKKIWQADSVINTENAITDNTATATVDTGNDCFQDILSEKYAVDGWQNKLLISLREAEPKPGSWVEVILTDLSEANEQFWQRLDFLLKALGISSGEAGLFISEFKAWLSEMGYAKLEEFKSELQYRLALALDMEEVPEEKKRFFVKLFSGLLKTREKITAPLLHLFSARSKIDAVFWEELEEILLRADVGFEATSKLIAALKQKAAKVGAENSQDLKELFYEELVEIFKPKPGIKAINLPEVVLMIGVNGVGKTTTIAKLAYRAHLQGKKVLIAAADTFRAAAIEQLEIWANRVGVSFYAKSTGADPAAVAYEAMDKAIKEDYDLVFIDTAGRLQNKVGLMEELSKIRRVIGKKHKGAPQRCLLVLDATTGQNALSQVKQFKEISGVNEIILSKLDGTAKGGVAVAIAMNFDIPITYIGLGEKLEDLRPFSGESFAGALLQ